MDKKNTQKKKKKGRSVQELLGIKRFTRYGLLTDKGELLFFLVTPTNISVLSYANIEAKIHDLQMLFLSKPGLEIVCTDASECFDDNKAYLHDRLDSETNPRIRKMLKKDIEFLDNIQIEMSTARQFLFIARCKGLQEQQVFTTANEMEKAISDNGFEVRRLRKPDIKRLAALYFDASLYGEHIPDIDGAQYLDIPQKEQVTAAKPRKKEKVHPPEQMDEILTKDFFDCILPSTIKFLSDHYIVGNSYRCAWAIREYPPSTEEQAILARLADRSGVTLRMYLRRVESMEQNRIIAQANRRNKLKSGGDNIQESVEAESNQQDVIDMLTEIVRNHEFLLHCATFIELKAKSLEALGELQNEINTELLRAKISVDRLTLRQKEGFLSVVPFGSNQFGAQFERVLPAASVANMFPFNYSGKTDAHGMYIGRDKYGTNILVDFDHRAGDKTNSNILILGNSGEGKSYLMKLILTILREAGKKVICLDPEMEYRDLCVGDGGENEGLGGTYIDFLSGEYLINPLEPKSWTDGVNDIDPTTPDAFKKVTRLSQHIAFLKDFFRSYKDFTDSQIDIIEILLTKLYARFGINDFTDFSQLKPTDFPIMEDFYKLCEEEFLTYDKQRKYLYTEQTLQEVCLGIHSMCVGSESKYFNGHTNIQDDAFLVFCVKGLMETNKRLRNAMLFNILSYMSNQLLGEGNTVASIDELYLFLSNMMTIEYIRNAMKRVRKKDSAMILASQNVDDFLIPGIREYTKPMFSIPTHQFLFYPGIINQTEFQDALQIENAEYDRIKYSARGYCLYRCGNERYLLHVDAPPYKAIQFGKAGGR